MNKLQTLSHKQRHSIRPLYFMLIALVSIIAAGCSSKQVLTQQTALETFPTVASLASKVEEAESADLGMLAPAQYAAVTEQLAKALKWAQANDPKSEQFAEQGLAALDKAKEQANSASDVFEEVLVARKKAIQAGAPQYYEEDFNQAEQSLLRLTRMLGAGDEFNAKAGRADVMKAYSDVELATLKSSTIDRAKKAISDARRMDVDNYAPKTFKKAVSEMELATSVLDADRSSTVKADRHSQTALYHARRATEIAEVVKHFNTSDFTNEDIVLWYQEQLERAVKPVNSALSFDTPNKEVVEGIASDLMALNSDYEAVVMELESTKMAKEEAITATETALALSKAESEKERMRNEAIASKFETIQTMFKASEADVYRQTDNVLIRAHGFQFASGKSDIDSVNFALLKKIIAAINEFPNANVVVSGHTDSQGDVNKNLVLSQERANKVANFLVEVGSIDAGRVTSRGFGEDQPVATNESKAGRAANRRVEVLIENSGGLL